MSRRSFSFLVNRLSGGGAAPGAVVPVARHVRDRGASVEVTYSPGPRATLDVVDSAVARGDVVVSVGGDGMLASIAGRVASRGGVLGVVPAGRGNDFARMLGLPSSPAQVASLLLDGEPVRTDLISMTVPGAPRRIVVGSVYAGVDAVAGELVDRLRWLPSRLQYPCAALRALVSYAPIRGRLVVDGERRWVEAATVVVANSAYYGSGMRISPSASVHDGVLDIVVIEAASRRALVRSMPTVYDGRHVELPEVSVLRGRRIELSGSPAVPVGGDGEPLGRLPEDPAAPVVVEVLPNALDVLCPPPQTLRR